MAGDAPMNHSPRKRTRSRVSRRTTRSRTPPRSCSFSCGTRNRGENPVIKLIRSVVDEEKGDVGRSKRLHVSPGCHTHTHIHVRTYTHTLSGRQEAALAGFSLHTMRVRVAVEYRRPHRGQNLVRAVRETGGLDRGRTGGGVRATDGQTYVRTHVRGQRGGGTCNGARFTRQDARQVTARPARSHLRFRSHCCFVSCFSSTVHGPTRPGSALHVQIADAEHS